MSKENKRVFKYSFPCFITYIFLGIGLGVLLEGEGFNALHGFLVSALMYSGTMSYLLVNFIHDMTSFIAVFLMTLIINGRYAFYGISFVDKFKGYPWYIKFVLLFTMSDESYSILTFADRTEISKDNMFFDIKISVFNYFYWIIGVILGTLLGKLPIDFTGIDFIMTALFVTIVVDQIRNKDSIIEAVMALILAFIFIVILNDNFIIPTIICGIVLLIILKKFIDKEHSNSDN